MPITRWKPLFEFTALWSTASRWHEQWILNFSVHAVEAFMHWKSLFNQKLAWQINRLKQYYYWSRNFFLSVNFGLPSIEWKAFLDRWTVTSPRFGFMPYNRWHDPLSFLALKIKTIPVAWIGTSNDGLISCPDGNAKKMRETKVQFHGAVKYSRSTASRPNSL